jgi:4-oxalomesaconate tautomerase
MRQHAIRCALMRGGTSKGAYFLAEDLPADPAERDALLLSIMGSPDATQIDGVGGGHPLRSKVAIVSKSTEPNVDVDYLFAQVVVEEPRVDTSQNCGNILAGVGPFAIERGLVAAQDGLTTVRVRTLNTNSIADLEVCTPNGVVAYDGDAQIAGVPGAAAPIRISFRDVAGSVCGALLPTGHTSDIVDGVRVTCIDNGMPVVVIAAASVDRTGYETVAQLNTDVELKARLERIRRAAAELMGMGDVSNRNVPKITLLAPPQNGGCVTTRNFIPHTCHTAVGVFAALSIATACILPGSVAEGIATVGAGDEQLLSIEHPTGEFEIYLDADRSASVPVIRRGGMLRTARMLFDGMVYAHAGYTSRLSGVVHVADDALKQ